MLLGSTSRGPTSGYQIFEVAAEKAKSVYQKLRRTSQLVRNNRKHRDFATKGIVSAQKGSTKRSELEDTEAAPPRMSGQIGADKPGPTAQAFSKAEEALSKLVSRQKGNLKVRPRDKALRALDFAGSPPLLFGSVIVFLLIAWDVFGGTSKFPIQSFYFLPHYIDWPVHAWVKGTFSPMLRNMAAEKLMSNVPIYIGSAGWLACAFAAVVQNPARGSRGVGITVFAMWVVSGVGSGRSDVLIVDILKQYFQRVRPSDIQRSFAFPSGHTTFAVFVIGALFYVILPLCVAGPKGDTEGGDLTAREGRFLDTLVSAVQASALPLWILGGAVTASGRILADVHWVSDTMGGACMGVFMVSTAAYVCKALRA